MKIKDVVQPRCWFYINGMSIKTLLHLEFITLEHCSLLVALTLGSCAPPLLLAVRPHKERGTTGKAAKWAQNSSLLSFSNTDFHYSPAPAA